MSRYCKQWWYNNMYMNYDNMICIYIYVYLCMYVYIQIYIYIYYIYARCTPVQDDFWLSFPVFVGPQRPIPKKVASSMGWRCTDVLWHCQSCQTKCLMLCLLTKSVCVFFFCLPSCFACLVKSQSPKIWGKGLASRGATHFRGKVSLPES